MTSDLIFRVPTIRALALLGFGLPLALSTAAFMPGEAEAQTVFTQRQIIQQLRIPQGQPPQRVMRRAPQNGGGQVVIKRRAPQPGNGGQVVIQRRAPESRVPVMRPPQPELAHGGSHQQFRAPAPERTTKRRAPQPDGGVAIQRRAPQPETPKVVKRRAPERESNRVASVRPVIPAPDNQRGIAVRSDEVSIERDFAFAASDYPEQGRIDLEILFDYDSDRIDPKSVRQLIELGEALNDSELGRIRFMIAGHTDAAGSNSYNADLSFRRARAVTEFLVDFAGIDPARLEIEGFGEEMLKYPDAPQSGQNRRVEIINLGEAG